MWVKKYTPKTFDEFVGNSDIVNRFVHMCKTQYIQHMILLGPNGVGKHTLLKLLLRNLLGAHYSDYTLVFTSSDNKHNQVIREKLHQFAPIQSNGHKKIVVFQHSEQLSDGVQQIMRRLMEKYYHHTTFVFICNSMDNLLETIQSRCHIFRFQPVSVPELRKHMHAIAQSEKLPITLCVESDTQPTTHDDIITRIAKMSHGDVRFCVNYFQSLSVTLSINTHAITTTTTNDGHMNNTFKNCIFPYYEDIHQLFDCLLNTSQDVSSFVKCVTILHTLYDKGYCGLDITSFMSNYLMTHDTSIDICIKYMKHIAICQDKMSKGVDSKLQLVALLSALTSCTS